MTGAKFTHVPYKGGGARRWTWRAASGVFGSIPQWQAHIASGKVRASPSSTRVRTMPDVPAVAETFPGFNNTTWYGLLGPAGTPAAIVNKVNAEMKRAIDNPAFVKHLETIGLEPAYTTPKEMGDLIRTELARWTKVVRDAGIQAN